MKQRRRRTRRRTNWLHTVATLLIIVSLFSVIAYANKTKSAAYNYIDTGHHYVMSGQTLWEIANLHSNNSHDTRQVIHIIKELNDDIGSVIYPGQIIVVPLFENMDWEYWDGE